MRTDSPISLMERDPKNQVFHGRGLPKGPEVKLESTFIAHSWKTSFLLLLEKTSQRKVLSYTSKMGREVALFLDGKGKRGTDVQEQFLGTRKDV